MKSLKHLLKKLRESSALISELMKSGKQKALLQTMCFLSFEMITPGNLGFINTWLTPAKNIGEVLNSEKSTNRSMRGNVVQFYIKMVTRYILKKVRECLIASQWALLKVIQRKCNSECSGCATDLKFMALKENNLYGLGTNRIWPCIWNGRKVQRAQYLQVKKYFTVPPISSSVASKNRILI